MGEARSTIERYYQAFDAKDPSWKELVDPEVRFEGPLQRASGVAEFQAITEMFLRFHKGTKLVARFEDGDRVCSIMEFDIATPAGGEMSCIVSELATVKDGRVRDVQVVYDPRAFAEAFGLS